MQLKRWLQCIRVLNILCASMMLGFQVWYLVALIEQSPGFFGFCVRVFAPVSIILLAVMILFAEFKYHKVVEHFKFLQFVPGLAMFNLFMASIMAFEFSTVDEVATIVVSSLFVLEALALFLMHCLKPVGTDGLLLSDV